MTELRPTLPRVAVIGAGISGLMCARTLADHGVPVTVFDKSRGVGGRMATRRSEDGSAFDHGAQYFTVRDEHFRRYVRSWQGDGLVECWQGIIRSLCEGEVTEGKSDKQRFVGTPTMTAVCKHLAADIDVRLGHEIASLTSQNGSWRLKGRDGSEYGPFEIVIVSAPSAQSARLLAPVAGLADLAGKVKMQPCWAVMVAFGSQLTVPFDGAFVQDSSLSWVARNSSKPARSSVQDCWVLHGSGDWSLNHAEDPSEEVVESLLEEFWRVTGIPAVTPTHIAAHRWRYALPPEPLEERCLFDSASGLGACGDWCSGPRVEGAFLSGAAAAECILSATFPESTARAQGAT
jgi:predicted NAD/FAD-dependent oxidoreductase